VLASLFAQASEAAQALEFDRPSIDWHAIAPEIVLLGVVVVLVIIDVVYTERGRAFSGAVAGVGLLAVMVPIITLAIDGAASDPRVLFDGAYVVDGFALVMKAMFVLSGYVVVLMSLNYIADGDYWENEYYELMLASLLGMLIMTSARDLVTIFVALELLSIPAYLLATWRKRDPLSNEAGMKYYLMGVFASAILLYGMSMLFGMSGSTILTDIGEVSSGEDATMLGALAIVFVIAGLAFKVSAFPFHTWSPDTYQGAPTPVTAFLSVASKAAGFVALMQLVFVGFWGRDDIYGPMIWVLAAASMFAGNFMALRQTNIVRMMAYSGVAQAGFMLAPLAVAGENPLVADTALTATVTYLVIYAAMNLGVFAVIIAVARKTGSAELDSYNGLFSYAPGLAVAMTLFLAALGGIPPLAGWFAKFSVFAALTSADTVAGYSLAVIAAINTVIAFGYYGKVASRMWFEEAPDSVQIRVPFALRSAVALALIATLVFGVLPQSVTHFTDVSLLALGP
jgi:NADH-quinone oxidoreductase subunit N